MYGITHIWSSKFTSVSGAPAVCHLGIGPGPPATAQTPQVRGVASIQSEGP